MPPRRRPLVIADDQPPVAPEPDIEPGATAEPEQPADEERVPTEREETREAKKDWAGVIANLKRLGLDEPPPQARERIPRSFGPWGEITCTGWEMRAAQLLGMGERDSTVCAMTGITFERLQRLRAGTERPRQFPAMLAYFQGVYIIHSLHESIREIKKQARMTGNDPKLVGELLNRQTLFQERLAKLTPEPPKQEESEKVKEFEQQHPDLQARAREMCGKWAEAMGMGPRR